MSKPPYFIVNPKAGGKRAARLWPNLVPTIEKNWGKCDFVFTQKEGDATRHAKLACEKGRSWIVAVGGDGTVHEVVNGMMQTGTSCIAGLQLGILSMGSGDDFVKSLGLSKDPLQALALIQKGRTKKIDVLQVDFLNHQGKKESRYCMNLSDFGLGGKVMQKVNASQKILGSQMTYFLHAVSTFFTFCPFSIVLETEERNYHFHKMMIGLVANGKYFGSGMCVAPEAKMSDGWMDVILVERTGMLGFLKILSQIYRKEKVMEENIFRLRAKRICVHPTSAKPVYIELDGEQPGTLPATYEVIPEVLKICM